MGRAERRKTERRNRIEDRKNKVLLTREDIRTIKKDIINDVENFKTEALMTCFALANHRLYGHDTEETMKTLQYIDELMGDILNDRATIDDYKRELEKETNVRVSCD